MTTDVEPRPQPTEPRQPRDGGHRVGAAALLVVAVVMSIFGDPVPSLASAIVVIVLAPMLQSVEVDYAPLTRALTRIADATRRRG